MEESRFIDFSKELMGFINESPSAFHVTANFADMLEKNGYSQLSEQDKWNLVPGGKYYVTAGYDKSRRDYFQRGSRTRD